MTSQISMILKYIIGEVILNNISLHTDGPRILYMVDFYGKCYIKKCYTQELHTLHDITQSNYSKNETK